VAEIGEQPAALAHELLQLERRSLVEIVDLGVRPQHDVHPAQVPRLEIGRVDGIEQVDHLERLDVAQDRKRVSDAAHREDPDGRAHTQREIAFAVEREPVRGAGRGAKDRLEANRALAVGGETHHRGPLDHLRGEADARLDVERLGPPLLPLAVRAPGHVDRERALRGRRAVVDQPDLQAQELARERLPVRLHRKLGDHDVVRPVAAHVEHDHRRGLGVVGIVAAEVLQRGEDVLAARRRHLVAAGPEPVAPLQVGDEDRHLAAGEVRELVADQPIDRAQVVGPVAQARAGEPQAHLGRARVLEERARAAAALVVARHDQRDLARRRQVHQESPRPLAGALEGGAGRVLRVHRRRRVDHADDGARAAAEGVEARGLDRRARHGEREQQDRRATQEQQDEVLDLDAPLLLAQRREQELHRGPPHDAVAAPEEEVDEDRNRDQAEARPEERGVRQGRHRRLPREAR
jgi:hypothetical protein